MTSSGPRATPEFLPEFQDHEVEVYLTLNTTREDVQACLERSGIVTGALIGECLIENITVYSPEDNDE